MDSFYVHANELYVEDLAIRQVIEYMDGYTPFYCYSYHAIVNNFKRFDQAFAKCDHITCFAVKANPNINILRILAELGSGADCVSEGEIRRALKAGINPAKIIFSGVGKTEAEIEFALRRNILQLNVESVAEIEVVNQIARKLGVIANIGIRLNPDVASINTHQNIITGSRGNKFGIPWQEVTWVAENVLSSLSNIKLCGLSVHIGSQITDLSAFEQAFDRVLSVYNEMPKGMITNIDLGGGIGIKYKDESVIDIKDYAELAQNKFNHTGCRIILEPGRYIVGDSAVLVSKVLYNKHSYGADFLIIDAGMNDA
jgi:diaminopimelate decarboxylase